jgi:predicted nucleotidyltransferase
MKLSIADMRAVLKERTQSMVGRKASEDPEMILAGVIDLRVVLDEMETYANELIETKKALANNKEEDL